MSGTYAQLPRLKIKKPFLDRFPPTHRRGDSIEEIHTDRVLVLEPDLGLERHILVWVCQRRQVSCQAKRVDDSRKLFMGLISSFVFFTVLPLVAIMILQWLAFLDHASKISNSALWGNWLLQPQAMLCEFILLGATYQAIRTRNLVFVIAVLMFNVYLVIAGFLEAAQREPDLTSYYDPNGHQISKLLVVNRLLWAVPIVDLCFHLGCDMAAFRLYQELGWLAYRTSSADLSLGKLHRRVLVLKSLTFFTAIFSLIELYTTTVLTLAAFPIAYQHWASIPRHPGTVAGANLASFATVLCWTAGQIPLRLGMARESKGLMIISLCIQAISYAGLFTAGALTLGLIRLVTRVAEEEGERVFAEAQANQWKTIFQFSVTTSLITAHIVMSVVVMRGFGKGLKERAMAVQQRDPELPAEKLDLLA